MTNQDVLSEPDALRHMMEKVPTKNWTRDAYAATESERRRLSFLRQLGVLDTPKDRVFQELVEEALKLVPGASIATITLIDADRQWFKASVGVDVDQTCRSLSFCSHVIQTRGILVVNDATKDPRFAGNPFVTGHPGIRFYAGVKLTRGIGALCVARSEPRDISKSELGRLHQLAQFVDIQLLASAAGSAN